MATTTVLVVVVVVVAADRQSSGCVERIIIIDMRPSVCLSVRCSSGPFVAAVKLPT